MKIKQVQPFFIVICLFNLSICKLCFANAPSGQDSYANCAVSPKHAYEQVLRGLSKKASNNERYLSYSKSSAAHTAKHININTATVAELTKLPRIGVKKAQAIVAYREQQGSFSSIEELTHIKGIGNKTVAKLAHRLTVQ